MMDNLSSHHYEGGEILEEWLYEMGIGLIYMPSYSPDLNPVEFCFSKVKGAMSRCYCASRICANLKYCLPTINQVRVKYDIVYNPAFDIRYIRHPCFKYLIN